LPLTGAPETYKLIAKSHRWQKTAVAAAAFALLGLTVSNAFALSLGRLTVQSALGEPLRAEIDVPDINAEETASLRTGVSAPEAFVAAGLEYNPAMSGLQTSLQRRPNGKFYIRLTSDRPINDPYIDIILETNWSSGRIVRDYTMLFDPPTLKTAPQAPTLAQTTPQPAQSNLPKPVPTGAPRADAPRPAPPSTPIAPAKPAAAAVKPAPAAVEPASQIVVKPGDTAGEIAANKKLTGVSLDQMLVALLRTNPEAFIDNNVNRIRAGAVLDLPNLQQAQAVPAPQARDIVAAQSKSFNDFRRNLASSAPLTAVATADRNASGTLEAKVEDKKPGVVTPDKLTLSKGAVKGQPDDAKILKERADKEAQERAAEIAKNLEDLKKVAAANAPETAPTPVPPMPAVAVPAVTVPESITPAPAPASPPVPAPTPDLKPMPAPTHIEPETPNLVDELLENPLIPIAAGGLLALLGGLAFWGVRRRRKNSAEVDSSFLESRLQPDSFFGASGGQKVDTSSEGAATGSSLVYSPSQLDAADDVDPVAEADVYLAYGRDLQAEEILKEAIKTTPTRLAIHTKLLEIYAKRRDTKNFEACAVQAHKITGSSGADWARVCEMGLTIDPENPMYQPGGIPTATETASTDFDATSSFNSTVAFTPQASMAPAAVSVDLDLDFSLDDEPFSAISDVTGSSTNPVIHDQTVTMAAASDMGNSIEMDFDLPIDEPIPAPVSEPSLPEISLSMDGLNMVEEELPVAELPEISMDLDFDIPAPKPAHEAAPPAPSIDAGMLEFDLGSLSLDLDGPVAVPAPASWSENENPLETKLALAEEFVSIGDEDGARALIEEVVAESTGEMRAKAQRALANLS
jgi:pilus assembly protein FimV